MSLLSFYNVRKPRQYEHKPIYWNPHKEALEERMTKIKREIGMEEPEAEYKPQIKGAFVEGTSHLKRSKEKGHDTRTLKYRNVKLIVALAVLAVLFWVMFWK